MYSRNKPILQSATDDRVHILNSPGAALADMIASPPEGSIKATITPKMAVEMLDYNRDNRPVRKATIRMYTRQMKSGDWRYTREPIIFSNAGRIIDGQHRLLACVEAGAEFTADIVFGAPDEAFAFIDVGAARHSSDIFAINGVKHYKAIAGMTRIVWNYDRGIESATRSGDITAAELYDVYLGLPGIDDSVGVFNGFRSARIASGTVMGAVHYICARVNRHAADLFFQEALDGGAGTSPARELHRKLVQNAISREKISGDGVAGLTLTAWNRSRRGKSGRGLHYPGGPLPRAI